MGDIKKEEEGDKPMVTNKKGTLSPTPVNRRSPHLLLEVERRDRNNRSTPENKTDESSSNVSHKQKTNDTFKKATTDKPPLHVKSRFPLTGSYGGIININPDGKEKEKDQNIRK